MAKRIDGITKHTLNLYAGDYAELQALFPDEGASVIIRKIVRRFLQRIHEEQMTNVPLDVEISL